MQRLILALSFVALFGTLGCNKPTETDCKSSCDHMYQLVAADRLAKASSKDKDKVKNFVGEYIKKHDFHIKECVSACRRKGTKAAVDCIKSRKTYKDLQQCKGK